MSTMVGNLKDQSQNRPIPFHVEKLDLHHDEQHLNASFCIASASLSQLEEEIKQFLHPVELEYLSTLSFAKRRHSYLLGRYVAKLALGYNHPHVSLTEVLIKPGVFEQPIVYHPIRKNVCVTLSHSEEIGVAVAFTEDHPMGIDIEVVKPENKFIIESELTQNEKRWIQDCPPCPDQKYYTLLWTIKEALSKALHTGLTTPFEIYAIKNTVFYENYWISHFEHFAQYQALSFPVCNQMCSIVYPKKTTLIFDVNSHANWSP